MNPEKEIVNLWLNKQGFFTINNINAGRNRIIDTIAVRQQAMSLDEVWHVEIHASRVSPQLTERERLDLAQKFENPQIISAVKKTVRELLGTEAEPKNVIVSTIDNVSIPRVDVVKFEDILLDVIGSLDKQNYRDDTLRSLQLVKYVLLRRPSMMRQVIGRIRDDTARRGKKVITELLSTEQAKSVLREKSSEQILIEILEGSSLASSEKFAKLLATKILSKRARAIFLKELLPQVEELEETRKEESLEKFI